MTTVHLLQAFPDVAEHYRRGSGTCWSTSTRTPTTRSTPWSASWCTRSATCRLRRAVRRRRRRPVDLRLPRRHDPQHPRVRGGLPRRDDDPARAELPLDADDPQRRQRGHLAQPQPQAQAAVDRRGRGRRRSPATSPTTSTTRRRSSLGPSTACTTTVTRSRATSRSSTAPTRSPGCSRRCSSGSGCPTGSSAASASTSAARSATRWPTCGCWPTPRTPCPAPHPQHARAAASATVPRRCSRRWRARAHPVPAGRGACRRGVRPQPSLARRRSRASTG